MTHLLYHIKAPIYTTNYKFAPVLVGDLAQFVDTNAGVSRSLLQAQITLFPKSGFPS